MVTVKERTTADDEDKDCLAVCTARYRWADKELSSCGKILDLACGAGFGSEMLSENADRQVSALDKNLSQANTKNELITWIQADVCNTQLQPDAYDAIVCFEIIEHLEEPPHLLHEAFRLLRPGGLLLMSTPNRETCPTEATNPWHLHVLSIAEAKTMLRDAGFVNIEYYGASLPKDRGKIGALRQKLVYLKRKLGIGRLTKPAKVVPIDDVRIERDDTTAPDMLFKAVKPL